MRSKPRLTKAYTSRSPVFFCQRTHYRIFAELEGLDFVNDAELVTALFDKAAAMKGTKGDSKTLGKTEWSSEWDPSGAEDMPSFIFHVRVCVEVGEDDGLFVAEVKEQRRRLVWACRVLKYCN
jgi:hypothetical protein